MKLKYVIGAAVALAGIMTLNFTGESFVGIVLVVLGAIPFVIDAVTGQLEGSDGISGDSGDSGDFGDSDGGGD